MEMSNPVIEVKRESIATIKPSSPTPSHLKLLSLSYVDQITTPSYTSALLVFDSPTQSHPLNNIATLLKTSLSKTLTHYYPLAGRITQSTIICNDEGVPFVEARVDCSLSTMLRSPRKLELLHKLLPPKDLLGNLEESNAELTHLAYQLNFFTCGGVALGWYDLHKTTDGISAATFLKHWETQAQGSPCIRQPNLARPDFEAAVKAFPPSPDLGHLLPVGDATKDHVQDTATVLKSFIFSNASVTELKVRAQSGRVPCPSRLQAVAGFIWERALHLRHSVEKEEETILVLTMDMRPWMDPPLPSGAVGNLATMAVARAEKNATKQSDLVVEIQTAVSKMKEEINGYKGEKVVEMVREKWNKRIEALRDYKERAYKVVSWINVGFNSLDFGFGKAKWLIPTDGILSPIHRNLIVLNDFTDSRDGAVGVEAWLFMEDKDMKVLESDQDFLYFTKLYFQ